MANYKEGKEIVLFGVTDEIRVPEIRIRYNRGKTFRKIKGSADTHEFLKKVYGKDISIQEQMVVLFLDNSLNILGYYRHTTGTPTASLIDIPMIMGIAMKAMARSVIISHNHPSGNTSPSEADRKITSGLVEAAKANRLTVLDHIIVTKDNGFYSFADNMDSSLAGFNKDGLTTETQLRQEILDQLNRVTSKNAPKVYEMIQTESGYRNVEQRIITMVVRDRITPSACIPQVENEL
jgi:DNA repair protein RadC